jgi:hypothetical protein
MMNRLSLNLLCHKFKRSEKGNRLFRELLWSSETLVEWVVTAVILYKEYLKLRKVKRVETQTQNDCCNNPLY